PSPIPWQSRMTPGRHPGPSTDARTGGFVVNIRSAACLFFVSLTKTEAGGICGSKFAGERNHQSLENRLIAPIERNAAKTGTIRRRQRLGGMLNYYYRDAA